MTACCSFLLFCLVDINFIFSRCVCGVLEAGFSSQLQLGFSQNLGVHYMCAWIFDSNDINWPMKEAWTACAWRWLAMHLFLHATACSATIAAWDWPHTTNSTHHLQLLVPCDKEQYFEAQCASHNNYCVPLSSWTAWRSFLWVFGCGSRLTGKGRGFINPLILQPWFWMPNWVWVREGLQETPFVHGKLNFLIGFWDAGGHWILIVVVLVNEIQMVFSYFLSKWRVAVRIS